MDKNPSTYHVYVFKIGIATLISLYSIIMIFLFSNNPDRIESNLSQYFFNIERDKDHVSITTPLKNKINICDPGEILKVQADVTNNSPFFLRSSQTQKRFERGVNIAYLLYNSKGERVYESKRFLLDNILKSHSTRPISIDVTCPKPGTYDLVVDIVQEGVNWLHLVKQKHDNVRLISIHTSSI